MYAHHEQILRTPRHKIQQRFHLEQLLNCQICYCKANNPTLCPHCSKLYCETCITKSLKLKPQCPNCRQTVKTQLTNCTRFLNELTSIVSSLIQEQEHNDKCTVHGIGLNYYCQDCKKSACCECKMFGQHQSHSFQPISFVYEDKYNRIRDLLSVLKSQILHKESILQEIENNLIAVKNNAETQLIEIDEYTELYRQKVAMEAANQNNYQHEATQALIRQLNELQQLKLQLNLQVEQACKTHIYKSDAEFMNKIEQALLKSREMLSASKNVASLEQAVPCYSKHSFIIEAFSKQREVSQPAVSPIIEYEGSQWRLLVYTNPESSQFMSVFLELVGNPDDISHYQYLVQLAHPEDPNKSIVKQHQAFFRVKQCLGYSKLIKFEELSSQGFISETDCLQIVFGVKMCYYYDVYRRRQTILRQLNCQIDSQNRKIEQLQSFLQNNSSTSINIEKQ